MGKNTSRKRDKDKKARVSIRRGEKSRNHARKQNLIAQLQANKPANGEKKRKAKNEE